MTRTLVLLGAALCAAVVLPADPGRCPGAECPLGVQKVYPEMGKAEETIERALDSPTTMEFVETPMTEVVEFLKDVHGIEMQIDQRALDEVGVGSDTPITISFKGISLRSALQLLLRDLELTYLVKHEVLLITTREMVEGSSLLMTRIYPVGDLLGLGSGRAGAGGDFDTLIDTITCCVNSDSWEQAGGPGSISVAPLGRINSLAVTQTYQTHRQVAALLGNLRKVAVENCRRTGTQGDSAEACGAGRCRRLRIRRCR